MPNLPTMALLVVGCASAPVFAPAVTPVPAAWDTPLAADAAPADTFWAAFGNGRLLALLQEAARANPDLRIARDRLRTAHDALLETRAAQQPSLRFAAGPADDAAASVAVPRAHHQAAFELGFDASYELDFWGRLRAASSGAQADADARAFDLDSARIGLASLVARACFDIAEADEAEALLHRGIALAEERRLLQTARQAAGRGVGDQLAEAQSDIAELRLQADDRRRQRSRAEGELALLLDRLPEDFAIEPGELRRTVRLPPVPGGLPSTLLQRRPDLRAAAARVSAAQARAGVALAEQFPQIRLTAQLGVATDVLHRAASGAVGLFGFGPQVELPILDGGARAARLDASRTEVGIAQLEYRKAAFAAFAEVEQALQQHEGAVALQAQAQDRIARDTRRLDVARAQLDAGHGSRLDILAIQEHALAAEQQDLEGYRAQLDSLVTLFEALGGGWDGAAPPALAAASPDSPFQRQRGPDHEP